MTRPAIRSRVLELQRGVQAARHGRMLLDQKREALQRALALRLATRAEALARASAAMSVARRLLDEARIEIGTRGLALAASAQQPHVHVTTFARSIVGVVLPDLAVRKGEVHLQYTLSDTASSVDRCAIGFATALDAVIAFAKEESAVRHLRSGLRRTTRRLNALDLLVIPAMQRELHDVVSAIEEEERDERLRTKQWLASR